MSRKRKKKNTHSRTIMNCLSLCCEIGTMGEHKKQNNSMETEKNTGKRARGNMYQVTSMKYAWQVDDGQTSEATVGCIRHQWCRNGRWAGKAG